MIFRLTPPYIPLIQKPTCCAVTCLQMILYRNGFGLHDQEELAVKFGVKISADNASAFSSAMPLMTQYNLDEGIQTVESEQHINAFLRANAPALHAQSFKHSAIKSLTDFLCSNLQKNYDLWVEYHAQEIYGGDIYKNGDYIHDGLVESFDVIKNEVIIIDSMPEHRQRLKISLSTLERGISTYFGRETGFIVIHKDVK